MALSKEEKAKIVKEFGKNDKDTGSIEVQIAILTKEINDLTAHLKEHTHDYQSKIWLLIKVGQIRIKLNYLMKNDVTKYREIINKLGLRK